MVQIGYAISSEELTPNDAVEYMARAEEMGFPFALVSDHYHPWVDRQGHSPFVWSVLGGMAQATSNISIGTGVTCPIIRIHPAIIAQAAATTAAMMPGRFFLGLGTGENLNEHILGDHWPPPPVRLDMLEEAIFVIRMLWEGGLQSHYGQHYTVEQARIYTLPDEPPPIMVAAKGTMAAELAGRVGDGLINTAPDKETIETFRESGGEGKPCFAQVHVCWAETEEEARRTAFEEWPNGGLKGPLNTELPLPSHFEGASQMVTEDDVAESVACGPDPSRHLEMINQYVEAGYDHIYIHQVGQDQEGFFDFYTREIMPHFQEATASAIR